MDNWVELGLGTRDLSQIQTPPPSAAPMGRIARKSIMHKRRQTRIGQVGLLEAAREAQQQRSRNRKKRRSGDDDSDSSSGRESAPSKGKGKRGEHDEEDGRDYDTGDVWLEMHPISVDSPLKAARRASSTRSGLYAGSSSPRKRQKAQVLGTAKSARQLNTGGDASM